MLRRVLRAFRPSLGPKGDAAVKSSQSQRVYDEETPVPLKGRNGETMMSSVAMPQPIASSPDLLQRLRESSDIEETPEQLDEQKVSFIFGNLPASSSISRDQVAARVVRSRAAA